MRPADEPIYASPFEAPCRMAMGLIGLGLKDSIELSEAWDLAGDEPEAKLAVAATVLPETVAGYKPVEERITPPGR